MIHHLQHKTTAKEMLSHHSALFRSLQHIDPYSNHKEDIRAGAGSAAH